MVRMILAALLALTVTAAAAAQDGRPLDALHRAAEQGIADAQAELASRYMLGEGVKRDPAAARMWYEKAAEQGHAKAQAMIGRLYMGAMGFKADPVRAALWMKKAALQGVPEAQLSLGTLYANGVGVEQNFIDAYIWLSLAARKLPAGDRRDTARGMRGAVRHLMTRDQVEQSLRRIDEMKLFGKR